MRRTESPLCLHAASRSGYRYAYGNAPLCLLPQTTNKLTEINWNDYKNFTIPYIRHFKSLGWQVDGIALNIGNDRECLAKLDKVWKIQWSHNAIVPRNFLRGVFRVRDVVALEN